MFRQVLLEDWGRKDPVMNFENFLREQQVLNEDFVGRIREELHHYIESELALVEDGKVVVPVYGGGVGRYLCACDTAFA